MAPRTICDRCGAYLSVAPGARSVRCPLCHTVARVERRPHGLHHAVVGFFKGLISSIVSPVLQPRELPPSYPRVVGSCKKRALLVGISYVGTAYELKGAVNDVNCMGYMLRERFKFPSDCILVMTAEDDSDPYKVPTKANLLLAMRWLVEGTSSGDSLVFHFSGHGVQKLEKKGDEVNGYNEALYPIDFERSGVLIDDEINSSIVQPLGTGVMLHAIIDTCHNGAILDLTYLCRISRTTGYWQWENQRRPSGEHNRTSGGVAISISGSQTSQDTTAFSRPTLKGAMTYSFVKAVESDPGTTYGRLITAMTATIRDKDGDFGIPGPIGTFFPRVISFSCPQEPQLCASEVFDINRRRFDF